MSETIAAISTAYGEGGIGIVRISGEKSLEILNKYFLSPKLEDSHLSFVNRKMNYGYIIEPSSRKIIDEVLVVFMKGPNTYTKEDVVEIYCHGSIVSLRKILTATLSLGADLAEPGEFTKRAFLNGRIDLVQADAIIDLIQAKTDKSHEMALGQLEGILSTKVNRLRNDLLDLLAEIVVNIDYPDEDIKPNDETSALAGIKNQLTSLLSELGALIATSETGRMIREGIDVVITGKPNVGKSSIMNALLRETRAIVSEVPGTTRDRIEEYLSVQGIPLKLTDTAGIRNVSNSIEAVGIAMSKDAIEKADLIALILDASKPLDNEDYEIANMLSDKNTLVIVNKTDLPRSMNLASINEILPKSTIIEISALLGEGLDKIEEHIVDAVYGGDLSQSESILITNVRHKDLLLKAKEEINRAIEMINAGEALDFIEVDVRSAFDYLGEITGQTVTDDILDRVFSRFCVGK